ncbi:related to SNF8 protein, involved in glucose derepression [Cephalotrichum gorgonifer]|uniref:Vacuolar-sorting protein SNF8 n=1 Tax=Cephalotrichum gorgonifer TaxID=2041049 RepID=A0AAE8SVL5_9PEZI|nr:related to SNF8 protein, involved in glucose derepression [Cephalotrichum gorgonifer]
MSRKGVGIAAFDRNRLTSAQFASHGTTLRTANAQALEAQLSVFRSLVQQFAATHAKDIRSNPSFRAQFARMCAAIGVDPLAASSSSNSSNSGSGSIWGQLLGRSVNDFYFELAVRVVEVCGDTRGENGGLLGLREACERIRRGRVEGAAEITEDDVLRAVETLKPLGSSYSVLHVGSKAYIRSVPRELNTDQSAVLEAAQVMGYVSVEMLVLNLGWTRARAQTAVEDLMGEGMLWVDKQVRPWEYWSPTFMVQDVEADT